MPSVCRIDDSNVAGGSINNTNPNDNVYANGKLISINGSGVSPDGSCDDNNAHCHPNTTGGCSNVFVHGIEVNFVSNFDDCGHVRMDGSPDVFACGGTSGGGAMLDFAPPYAPHLDPQTLPSDPPFTPIAIPAPPGGQPLPPPEYIHNTESDIHVYENNDVPGDLGTPPPSTMDKQLEEQQSDQTPPPATTTPVQDCSNVDLLPIDFNWFTYYGSPAPEDFSEWCGSYPESQLTPNFNVADLTINTAVSYYPWTESSSQESATQKEILQNMCYLTKTILEPFVADSNIPTFTITSGFRNKTGSSQHNVGQAVDLQFLDFHGSPTTGQQYYDLAAYIRDNFNFDQMILEWFGKNPWIHISVNPSNHRHIVLTQIARNNYSSGLILLS